MPDSPPIIPVLVPFLVTSSPVPGGITGAVEAGTDVLAGGVTAGEVVAAGGAVDDLRSLHAPSDSANNAAEIGTKTCTARKAFCCCRIVVSPSYGTTLLGPVNAVACKAQTDARGE